MASGIPTNQPSFQPDYNLSIETSNNRQGKLYSIQDRIFLRVKAFAKTFFTLGVGLIFNYKHVRDDWKSFWTGKVITKINSNLDRTSFAAGIINSSVEQKPLSNFYFPKEFKFSDTIKEMLPVGAYYGCIFTTTRAYNIDKKHFSCFLSQNKAIPVYILVLTYCEDCNFNLEKISVDSQNYTCLVLSYSVLVPGEDRNILETFYNLSNVKKFQKLTL